MAAVRQGLAGGPEAAAAAAYVAWMAERQIAGGAAYLDLNVDEIDPETAGRVDAMTWLVRAVGPRLQRAALHRLLGRDRPGGRA